MRIKQISTAVLESNFDWTLVKVETANGIIGYGESFLGPGLPAVIQEFASVLSVRMRRRLIVCFAGSAP